MLMRATLSQSFKVILLLVAVAVAVTLTPSPAMGQAATNFGSNSGVTCPGGNIICNGSINVLTTELFFEPETPSQGLKDALVTWNEVEYILDNPYVTGGNGNAAVYGGVCRDGSGFQPINEQGFPSYCTAAQLGNPASVIFNKSIPRPPFGVTHPVAGGLHTTPQIPTPDPPPPRIHP